MSKYVFLDLETTGLESKDRICELALIVEGEDSDMLSHDLCKSPKKISKEAMSIHHITNEMVSNSPLCDATGTYELLQECNVEENLLIAHNVNFDLSMLEKEGFHCKMGVVDTLRCVKALIPECEKFNLQFLRYELNLYKEENALAEEMGVELNAHRALSDCLHLKLLWKTLLQYATVSQLIEISANPVLLQKLPFGKYAGRYIEEICELDRGYLHWMIENIEDMDDDVRYSIRHHMKEL